MAAPEPPYRSPESTVETPEPTSGSRTFFRSPAGRALVNIAIVVLSFVFLDEALKTNRIMNLYGVKPGTLMWLVCVLTITSSLVAFVCLLLTRWFWSWAVLLWCFLVSAISLLGFSMGLNPEFVFRWDVFLPWALLVVTFIFEKPYGNPRSIAT